MVRLNFISMVSHGFTEGSRIQILATMVTDESSNADNFKKVGFILNETGKIPLFKTTEVLELYLFDLIREIEDNIHFNTFLIDTKEQVKEKYPAGLQTKGSKKLVGGTYLQEVSFVYVNNKDFVLTSNPL